MRPAVTRHRRGSTIRSDAAAVAAASALLAAGAAPQIISGPLAPYLRLDLGISSSELGLGLSLSAVPAVVLAVWLGRVTDRVGGINVGRLTCIGGCFFVVALSQAPSTAWFVALLAAAGILRVLSEPSSSRILVDFLARTPRVLAFGIREAAMPLLVLVSTAVLPVFGDRLGWRTVFAACSVFALTGLALLMGPARPRKQSVPVGVRSGPAAPVTAGPPRNARDDVASLGLGFLGGAALLFINLVVFNAFASLSFVDAGASADTAAALVAASAGGSVLMRIGCAHAVTRRDLDASQDHRGHGRGGGCRLCGDGHGQHGADVRRHSGGVRGRLGVDAAAFCPHNCRARAVHGDDHWGRVDHVRGRRAGEPGRGRMGSREARLAGSVGPGSAVLSACSRPHVAAAHREQQSRLNQRPGLATSASASSPVMPWRTSQQPTTVPVLPMPPNSDRVRANSPSTSLPHTDNAVRQLPSGWPDTRACRCRGAPWWSCRRGRSPPWDCCDLNAGLANTGLQSGASAQLRIGTRRAGADGGEDEERRA